MNDGRKAERNPDEPPRTERLLFAALLVCAALFLPAAAPIGPAGAAGMVIVYLESEVYATLPLGEETTLTIEQAGAINEIAIGQDGVWMQRANCRNQDCVEQGKVTLENRASRPLGAWIICLPNRVSIELIAGGPKSMEALL